MDMCDTGKNFTASSSINLIGNKASPTFTILGCLQTRYDNRETTFQLTQSQDPSSVIQSVFSPHRVASGSYPIQHGGGGCLGSRDLDRKLD